MKEIPRYDPNREPDPEAWLALDEAERIELVRKYYVGARVKLPNARLHAATHAIVETQAAMGDALPVGRTLARLQAEGLDRHDALHAVGAALMHRMYDLMKDGLPEGDPNVGYWAELEQLTAENWRRSG
jgi:hypothetical protein